MKNHLFLWLRNRTTDNRKCEKARNIKEKRTIEMFNTVSKQLVEHLSSLNDNFILSKNTQDPRKSTFLGSFFRVQNNSFFSNGRKSNLHLSVLLHITDAQNIPSFVSKRQTPL